MPENFQVVFVSRPGVNGEPSEDNFACVPCPYPSESLNNHEVIVKTLYLSVDPALRCRMNESTGVAYMNPWVPGQPIDGLGGVGLVIHSSTSRFQEGDLVHGTFAWPWKLYFTQEALELHKVDSSIIAGRPSLILSCLGLAGLTSLLGIREKGHVTQGANQTFVVSAAAGACGSLAGQIARLEGCSNVVGICGTDTKCEVLTKELKFDHAINYKTQDVSSRLTQTCPNGIDVYFDNVGGELSDTVVKQMNPNSHIILCGQISVYNKDVPYPPPVPEEIQKLMEDKNITRERFLILKYQEKFEEGLTQLAEWLQSGKLKVKETIADGLENAGKAFVSMMKGGNIGKQLVHVADP